MLRTKLFGVPEFSIHAQSLDQTLTGRRLALFAYLLSQEQPSPRSVLSDLLWVDLPEERARENLRSLLSHTRRVIGGYLVVDRQAVAFQRAAPYWADVEAFGTFFAAGQTNADPALLSETLQLYRGEFLAGFYIQGAPIFEGWLLGQRQRWHEQAVQGWRQLAHYHFTQGDDAAGLLANERLLALEPWHEEAHRRQMVMLARSGRRDAALAYFDHCCAILREEVDAPPDEETVALYEQIKVGVLSPNGLHNPHLAPVTVAPITVTRTQFEPQAPTQHKATNGHPVVVPPLVTPAPSPIAIDWGAMPHEPRFHGRQAELRQLQQWCVHERRRVVTVFGVGGQGKTALAVRFIRTLSEAATAGNGATEPGTAPAFERVIWRSLLAAPPLTDILQDWLQQLSDQQVVTRPPTLDQQFTLLHDYLQRRRFLLVLDNVESILVDDGFGACRSGYEPYEQLWQLFAQRDHQCCLLLTSRERPRVFSSHEEQTGAVRTLLLDGLAPGDGQQLLRAHRVAGSEAELKALLQCYSGNPLALKLVADTLDELFDGNVEAFLQEETPFFADIAAVLDQQFARLSPLEIELLTWLALEQEPITSQTLWENLVAPPAKRDFLTALRTLVRRSLVQTQGELFSLQNVILEYTRNGLVHRIGEELTNDKMTGRQDDKRKAETGHLVTLSSPHPLLQSAFNRYALRKAHAKAYISNGQQQLVVKPICDRLRVYWGDSRIVQWSKEILTALRDAQGVPTPLHQGYAAANLLHLLLQMPFKLQGADFSGLTLRQATLRDAVFHNINFANADFQACRFVDTFAAATALAFHPGGELLAVGTYDGQLRLIRTGDQQLEYVHADCANSIFGLAFSADGDLLAISYVDQKICVLAWQKNIVCYTLQEPVNFVRSLAFSPNGRWLAVAGGDGLIKLYHAATGKRQHTLTGAKAWIWALAYSPDGKWVAAGDEKGQITLWQISHLSETDEEQVTVVESTCSFSGHRDCINSLVFSPTSSVFFSGGRDGLIHLWQIHTVTTTPAEQVRPWRILQGHQQAVRQVAISAHGRTLASAGADATVRIWDAEEGILLDTLIGHEQSVWAVAFHPRPQRESAILASGGNDQRIMIWMNKTQEDDSDYQLYQTLTGYSDTLRSVAFLPGDQQLISGGIGKQLSFWDLPTGQRYATLSGHQAWVIKLAVNRARHLVASSGFEFAVYLWSLSSDKRVQGQLTPRRLHGHTAAVWGLAFSPDGRILASCSLDWTIRLWDTTNGQLLQTLSGHQSWVYSVAFSPDGHWLASGSMDKTVRIWDIHELLTQLSDGGIAIDATPSDRQLGRTFTGHTARVWMVAFTPNGETVVSVSSDHTVRLWSREGQQAPRVLTGHTNTVRSLAVSPPLADGSFTLATGDDDQVIHIWDGQSGKLLHRLQGHRGVIYGLDYSAAGTLLASASEAGGIRLWDVQTGALLHTLRAPRPYSGMNITGVTGITPAQKAALLALGAVEE